MSAGPVVDLMAALKASVRAARIARGENPDAQPLPMYPTTKDDADCAEAERRAERRRGEHG